MIGLSAGDGVRVANILTGEVLSGVVVDATDVRVGDWTMSFARSRRGRGDCKRWVLILAGEDAEQAIRRWRTADGYGRTLEELRAEHEERERKKRAKKKRRAA